MKMIQNQGRATYLVPMLRRVRRVNGRRIRARRRREGLLLLRLRVDGGDGLLEAEVAQVVVEALDDEPAEEEDDEERAHHEEHDHLHCQGR